MCAVRLCTYLVLQLQRRLQQLTPSTELPKLFYINTRLLGAGRPISFPGLQTGALRFVDATLGLAEAATVALGQLAIQLVTGHTIMQVSGSGSATHYTCTHTHLSKQHAEFPERCHNT